MSTASRQSPAVLDGPGPQGGAGPGIDEEEPARSDSDRAGAAHVTYAANSIANYAVGLLVSLIVLLVAILVGGEFAGAIPTNSPFSSALNTTINTAGTAFELFGITLIILPGVAAVALVAVLTNRRGGMGGLGR